MAELWYEAELKRPSLVTVEVRGVRFVEILHQTIEECMRSKQKEEVEFAQTAALLSRIIARRASSFRRLIGFRNLLKLNAATCRLLKANLTRALKTFCEALPDMVCGENAIAALPTKNCLDYVLVRLLSVYTIQRRIHEYSVSIADYFLKLLRANNFFDMNTLLLTVIGKLRTLNFLLSNIHTKLYHKLLKYRKKFPLSNRKSLISDSMKLPGRLEAFDMPVLEANEEIINTTTFIKSNLASTSFNTPKAPKTKKHIDVGMEWVRSESANKLLKEFSVDQLKTVYDVRRFIATENETRKKSSSLHTSIAHRIPSHLWVGSQKVFERKLKSGDYRKAMRIFLKFLSSYL